MVTGISSFFFQTDNRNTLIQGLVFRGPVFAHPEAYILTHPALLNNLPAVVGDDPPDLVELVRFDQELK